MTLGRLIYREIRYCKGSFWLGVALVTVAVVCFLGALMQLRGFDRETDRITLQMERATADQMQKLEDQIRVSMKGLGFNIFIYPEAQDLSEIYETGVASHTMPESYVETLAQSRIVTVNHLLPRLSQRVKWEEYARSILLIGIRGEVPLMHRDPKKPLLDAVAAGTIVIGHELGQQLKLSRGAEVDLLGKKFTVDRVHEERGSVDDVTVWMNLGQAQELLGKQGRVTSILALECNCASVDRLGEIRAELRKILPDTKIIEKQSQALARAEARQIAKRTADEQRARKQEERRMLRGAWERAESILVPIITVLSMGGIAILTILNVRGRWAEIGTLRAIGVSSGKVLGMILGKTVITGLAGVLFGFGIIALLRLMPAMATFPNLVTAPEYILVLVAAPLLAAAAGWLPALMAAQKHPSDILRHG